MATSEMIQILFRELPSPLNEMMEGIRDASRAIVKGRVKSSEMQARRAERDAKCKAGDSYSCGVVIAIDITKQIEAERRALKVQLRRFMDTALKFDDETRALQEQLRGLEDEAVQRIPRDL